MDTLPLHHDFEISIPVSDIQTEWARCSLLANYIGEYVAFEYPQREWVENLLSTISNELLETAVYLAPDTSELRLIVKSEDNSFVVTMTHLIKSTHVSHYQSFISALSGNEKHTLYLSWLTNTDKEDLYFNQLGLCMLSNDFDVELQVQLDLDQHIETRLQLPIKEL